MGAGSSAAAVVEGDSSDFGTGGARGAATCGTGENTALGAAAGAGACATFSGAGVGLLKSQIAPTVTPATSNMVKGVRSFIKGGDFRSYSPCANPGLMNRLKIITWQPSRRPSGVIL